MTFTLTSALRGSASARTLAIALSTPLAFAVAAHAGPALPTSGHYIAGKGTIAKTGSHGLTINQSSNTGIIDWKSFSVGKGAGLQFNNGSGATLNRVTGGNLSTIAGSLHATGSLYVINTQGVIVSGSGRIVTGGTFAASSRDTSDSDFMDGKRHFSGRSKGDVSNAGSITSRNGDAILIGRAVSNSGDISAASGTASLNAGNKVYLAPAGSNGQILVHGGSGDAANSGTIQSAQAQLNAAGGNVYALGGNNGGIIRAAGTKTIAGHVWLTSGTGNAHVSGNVSAQNADGSGGAVDVAAHNIAVAGNIDVSATAAHQQGGKVSVIASNAINFSGSIKAQGGAHGKGGSVETSGAHLHVADGARVNTLSAHGSAGVWVIDPNDLTIAPTGGDISGATITANLANGAVFLFSSQGTTSGNGDIFVNDDISWSSANELFISAARNIEVKGTITNGGIGLLDLEYGGALDFVGGKADFTGTGVEDDASRLKENNQAYTLVTTIASLAVNVNAQSNGHYALASDYAAPATAYSVPPITSFLTGAVDGLGHTISNLSIAGTATTNGTEVGLFREVDTGGAIRNISLTNVNITSAASAGTTYMGALVGYNNGGTLSDISVSGTVTGAVGVRTGGIVGYNTGSLLNSSSSATVSTGTGAEVGGMVGYNGGTMTNDTASGTVNGANNVGGLVGYSDANGIITASSASGDVIASLYYAGGLAGESYGAVTNSSASGNATAVAWAAGLIGYMPIGTATTSGSHASGNATGTFDVGGLVGFAIGSVTNSYATGNANGTNSVGGLIGINNATVSGSYATGTVTAVINGSTNASFGGLIGNNRGTISGSYATGAVNVGSAASTVNGDYVGGFIGQNNGVNANISTSHATGAVTVFGTTDAVGGFIGINNNGTGGTIATSYATGSITDTGASEMAGGLVGKSTGAITNSWAGTTVNVIGDSADVGGLVGLNTSSIQYDYAIGTVTATGNTASAGGLVGADTGTIDNTYATGLVTVSGSSGLEGGLVGSEMTAAHLTTSYWDETTTGRVHSIGTGGGTDTAGALGLDTTHALMKSLYANFDFTGSGHWVIFDGDTRPMLTAEESTTITNGHQLQLMAMNLIGDFKLANDIDLSGEANPSDVWKVSTGFVPIGSPALPFEGSLSGYNHTITGLFINRPSTNDVGLFGEALGGVLTDFGFENSGSDHVTGASYVGALAGNANGALIINVYSKIAVSGGMLVGGLVGTSSSEIDNSFATGAVTGNTSGGYVGGLIGASTGSISDSYATGFVTNLGDYTGGLVGDNAVGSISGSFATGEVQGKNYTGGLVGENDATISDSYAMGLVAGTGATGGLVGHANGGGISNSYSLGQATGAANQTGGSIGIYDSGLVSNVYWDTATSGFGIHNGAGNTADAAGLTGLTSAQLKGTLQSGFSQSIWSVAAATPGTAFAYLQWQYAAGFTPQTISGRVTQGADGANAVPPGAQINLLVNGTAAGTAYTYADGSYYLASVPMGATDDVLAYIDTSYHGFPTSGVYAKGNAYVQDAGTGSLSNVDIYENALHAISDKSSMSALMVGLNVASGGATNTDFLFDAGGVPTANKALALNLSASSFGIDVGIDTGTADVVIDSARNVTQTQKISASGLALLGGGNFTLTHPNNAFSYVVGNVGSLNLFDGQSMGITSGLDGAQGLTATGPVTLGTTTGANLFIGGNLTDTGALTLNSGLGIVEGSEVISAASLKGSSHGSVSLDGSNSIGSLGAFDTGGSGDFDLTNTKSLSIAGALNAGTGEATLTTAGSGHNLTIANTITSGTLWLIANGTITESGSGKIIANTLTGSSVGATELLGANVITDLGAFTTGGNHIFELTDAHDLTVTGAVTSGSSNIHLTTTGSGHDIFVQNALTTSGSVYLVSAATIADSGLGKITAKTLTGSSVGTAELNDANVITNLGAFTTGGNHTFELTDAHDLTVTGAVTSGSSNLHLTTTGSGHDIFVQNALTTSGSVYLKSAATIYDSGAGLITAKTLTGSSVGATELLDANVITNLGAFTTGGNHTFELTDAHDLTVTGVVTSGSANLHLKTTGSGHDIFVQNALTTSGSVYLVSAATIADSGAGLITAKTLTGSSVGTTELLDANVITNLGAFTTGGNHTFELTDAHDLTVTGAVTSGSANLHLTTTGSGHDIFVQNALTTSGTVYLKSAATVSESGSGKITAKTLTGSSAGAAELNDANVITDLGAFNTANHVFELTDAHSLTITGAVTSGTQNLHLTTTGSGHDIAVNAGLTAATVYLVSAGKATESAAGAIIANLLNVTAQTGITLTSSANNIKKLGTDKTTSGSNKVTL